MAACARGVFLVGAAGPIASGTRASDDRAGPMTFQDPTGAPVVLRNDGAVYLVDFFGVGCKPCAVELPALERLRKEFSKSDRFEPLVVVHGWLANQPREIVTRESLPELPWVADPEGHEKRLGVEGFPTKFLIRDGRILTRRMGGSDQAYRIWKPLIAQALRTHGVESERQDTSLPAGAPPPP